MGTMLAFLGSLGTSEIIIIFVIIFLLFGAKKLPELARGIGKSLGEFKKAKSEFENELLNSETKAQDKKPEDKKIEDKPEDEVSAPNPYLKASVSQPQDEPKGKEEQK